jgi:hypothetical protein
MFHRILVALTLSVGTSSSFVASTIHGFRTGFRLVPPARARVARTGWDGCFGLYSAVCRGDVVRAAAHRRPWCPRSSRISTRRISLTLPLGRLVASSSRSRRNLVAAVGARARLTASRTRHTAHSAPPATRHSPLTLLLVSSPSLAVAVADKALGRFLAEAVESGAPDVALAPLAPLAPLAEAVGSLDVDGDGLISVEELLERAAEEGVTLSREEAEKFVQICDELGSEGMDGLCDVDVRAAWFPQRWCLFVLPPAGARSHPALSLVRSLVRSLDRQEYLISLSTVVYGSLDANPDEIADIQNRLNPLGGGYKNFGEAVIGIFDWDKWSCHCEKWRARPKNEDKPWCYSLFC